MKSEPTHEYSHYPGRSLLMQWNLWFMMSKLPSDCLDFTCFSHHYWTLLMMSLQIGRRRGRCPRNHATSVFFVYQLAGFGREKGAFLSVFASIKQCQPCLCLWQYWNSVKSILAALSFLRLLSRCSMTALVQVGFCNQTVCMFGGAM